MHSNRYQSGYGEGGGTWERMRLSSAASSFWLWIPRKANGPGGRPGSCGNSAMPPRLKDPARCKPATRVTITSAEAFHGTVHYKICHRSAIVSAA